MDELGYKISIIVIVIILIVGACMLLAYVTLMGLKIAKTRSNRVNGENGKTQAFFMPLFLRFWSFYKNINFAIFLSSTINGYFLTVKSHLEEDRHKLLGAFEF